jgi:hypothetical protein
VSRALLLSVLLLGASARGADDGYSLVQTPASPVEIKAGKKATLSLTVLPHAGYRLLADGPVELRLAGEGVKLPRPSLHREDAVDPRAEAPRFELAAVAAGAGPGNVAAECTFYLCRESRCRPVVTTVRWSLTIAP